MERLTLQNSHRFGFFVILFIVQIAKAESISFKDEDPVALFDVENVRLSKIEKCLKKTCQAYDVAVRKKIPKIKTASGGVNPASFACRELKGEDRIGKLADENEISVCQFSDNSFLVTWDLLKRR